MAGAEWRDRWRGRAMGADGLEGPASGDGEDDEDADDDWTLLAKSMIVSVSSPESPSLSERSEGVSYAEVIPESSCMPRLPRAGTRSSSSSPIPSSSVSSCRGSIEWRWRSGGFDGSFQLQPRLAQSCFHKEASSERARHRRLTRLDWRRLFQGRKEKMWRATSVGSSYKNVTIGVSYILYVTQNKESRHKVRHKCKIS